MINRLYFKNGFYHLCVDVSVATRNALVGIALVWSLAAQAQTNIPFQSGPIMQTPTVYLVFWLPPNATFDPSVANGIGNYETVLTNFFNDISPSTYYSIVGQYAGKCGSNSCLVQNARNAVRIGGTFVDTRAYAHADGTNAAGSDSDPLLDTDIQHEIQLLINQFGLSDGVNTEFFVYVGDGIQECQGDPKKGAECTFLNPAEASGQTFCAYHSAFTDANGNDAVYAFMADDIGLSGCEEGVVSNSPNGQISSDREVVITTHELFESVSDPLSNAWVSSGAQEIGDNCNQDVGTTQSDGSNVVLNGARFVVQQIWSNFTSSCSLGVPSIQLQIGTGGDDLRSDSSATVSALSNVNATLQTFMLHAQDQTKFDNNTIYQQMFGFDGLATPQVGSISITLTSHNGLFETDDNWNIQGIVGQILDATGNVVCQFVGSGTPLMRLTGDEPTGTLATPNCTPPPVCSAGLTLCSTNCVDLNSSSANCGRCGNACIIGQLCSAKTCACPAGTALCCSGDLGCRQPGKCPKNCP